MSATIITLPRRSGKTYALKRQIIKSVATINVIVCIGKHIALQWIHWIHRQGLSTRCRVVIADTCGRATIRHVCSLYSKDVSVFVDDMEFVVLPSSLNFWQTIMWNCKDLVLTRTTE